MQKFIKAWCTITVMFLISLLTPAAAKSTVDPCKNIIVAANINWPPYAVFVDEELQGFAVNMAKDIVRELDIPVSAVKMQSQKQLLNSLALGEADILVSTYKHPDYSEIVDIISPGFILDPITILVTTSKVNNYKSWDDLIGFKGAIISNFVLEEEFSDYALRYLSIKEVGSLQESLKMLAKKQIDYVIGSKLQLQYAMQNSNYSNLSLGTLMNKQNVYMGFAKNSACYAYMPFIKKRIKDFKQSKKIEQYLSNYISRGKS